MHRAPLLIFLSIMLATGCSRNPDPAQPQPLSADKTIKTFVFQVSDNPTTLKSDITASIAADTIKATFIAGTDMRALVPSIVFTGKSISPANKSAQDFTKPLSYVVTAEDGSTKTYVVAISFVSDDKTITAFSFRSADNSPNIAVDVTGAISADSVNLTVPAATNIRSLVPFIMTTGKAVSPASLAAQDFTSPVTYTVTAQDGATKTYTVKVTSAPSTASGTIFVAGATDNYYTSDSGTVYALDAATGALKWSYVDNSPIYAAVTAANNIVYESDKNGYVFALDAASGNMIWKSKTSSTWTNPLACMALANGILYQGWTLDSSIYALDASTGSILWKFGYGASTVLPQ